MENGHGASGLGGGGGGVGDRQQREQEEGVLLPGPAQAGEQAAAAIFLQQQLQQQHAAGAAGALGAGAGAIAAPMYHHALAGPPAMLAAPQPQPQPQPAVFAGHGHNNGPLLPGAFAHQAAHGIDNGGGGGGGGGGGAGVMPHAGAFAPGAMGVGVMVGAGAGGWPQQQPHQHQPPPLQPLLAAAAGVGLGFGMEGMVPAVPVPVPPLQLPPLPPLPPMQPQLLPQLPRAPIPLPPPGAGGALPLPLPLMVAGGLGAGYLLLDQTYPGLRLLHVHPPLYAVADFLSAAECDALMHSADGFLIRAPVVGAGNGELSGSRTSSTCYFAREDVPTVVAKVCRLTGKPPEHVELPQVGRYLSSQEYKQHFDAFDLATEDGRRFAENGGQRVATVLIYLNDVSVGGKTHFPRLNLSVTPTKGMALVFFPATLDGRLDEWALHAAEPAIEEKWVSQVWIRQGAYTGVPTRRMPII